MNRRSFFGLIAALPIGCLHRPKRPEPIPRPFPRPEPSPNYQPHYGPVIGMTEPMKRVKGRDDTKFIQAFVDNSIVIPEGVYHIYGKIDARGKYLSGSYSNYIFHMNGHFLLDETSGKFTNNTLYTLPLIGYKNADRS
jgi:hypothetical protein